MTVACPTPPKFTQCREALLLHWRSCSDREIAASLGVSNRTVSLQRKQLEREGLILPRLSSTQPAQACQYEVCTSAVQPASLNDELYDPVDENESSFLALVTSIEELGILEPIVVSADGYILSGHRRYAAACVNGLERIPVRIRHDVSWQTGLGTGITHRRSTAGNRRSIPSGCTRPVGL